MEILLIEDCRTKIEKIKKIIDNERSVAVPNITITLCTNLRDATKELYSKRFDLIVFDFYLPLAEYEDTPTDVSSELLYNFTNGKNYTTESLAVTRYDLRSIENIDQFNLHGVTVVQYVDHSSDWEMSLVRIVRKVFSKPKFDFLIFCALIEERMAYAKTSASVTKLFEFRGLNCQEISIGDLKGLCIVPPRVGPVNTAISVAKSIDYFQPKIVTMSGICAGFGERVGLLDIIVADTVWDYSVGKETDSGFKSEQYQQTIDDSIRTYINQMIEDGSLLESFKHELFSQEVCNFKLLMGPVVSGSAVVASRSKMLEIGEQHRKVLGLDMEISALYEAAARSLNKPLFLAVKSVVDTGDANKDDSVHDKACILSAKFLVKFINDFCCRLTSK